MSTRPLDAFLHDALASGRAAWSTRPLVEEAARPGFARIDGREVMVLSSNDYLGLACDPRVVEAAARAAATYGVGARASRALGGDTRVHHELEEGLADLKQAEACLLFGSGFSCNAGVIPALARACAVVYSDERNHASIVDGCRLSAAPTAVYRHGDAEHLAELLERDAPGVGMIVSDAVFSMEGDLAPLPRIVELAEQHGAFVMLDEAHATGVLGPGGEGATAHFGLHGRVDVVMGTLGKALGSVGGFIAGSRDLIDYLAAQARSFVFTTAPPTPAVAAASTALRIMRTEPERLAALRRNEHALRDGLREAGYDVLASETPILPVRFRSESEAGAIAAELRDAGIVVQATAAPYVPAGTSRIRIIASAAHEPADVERALDAFARARSAVRTL
jgi:8-amino-7-oxononanoate synthase